jgi:spore coat protein A, manganese oxidase
MSIQEKFLTHTAPAMLLTVIVSPVVAEDLLPGDAVPKYVNELPIPAVLMPTEPGGTEYEVIMSEFQQFLGIYSPTTGDPLMTTVWGYNGFYPGPTFEAHLGTPISVRYINDLPESHLLPLDTTIHGANMGAPEVRAVVHLHGGHIDPEYDGGPDDWFVPGEFVDYWYRNDQEAATLWYHDHALGITRLNVYAGLAGFYLVRDDFEDSLNLPADDFEVPIVIQDRSFYDDGSLAYPDDPIPGTDIPSIVPEFFGDVILVNGMAWPYLEVEPRKYRFRVLNGSNSRFYNLRLTGGPMMWQIGTDGGFLPIATPLSQLLLSPGERADLIVDFSMFEGETIIMRNNAKAPFPMGEPANPQTTGQIMQFRVTKPLSGPDESNLPIFIRDIEPLMTDLPPRYLDLVEEEDEFGRVLSLLNGMLYDDEVTEIIELDTTEEWVLINATVDAHPIHLHQVQFQVISRQKFNAQSYMPGDLTTLRLIGLPKMPPMNERGPKDTVIAYPGEVTRIIAHFDIAGRYVWHCHILEHEDHEMMRPFDVVEP